MALGGELDAAWRTMSEFSTQFVARLPLFALGLIVLAAFIGAGALARRLARRWTKERKHANVGLVVGRLLQAMLVFVGILVAAGIIFPGIDAGNLVALLGLSSVAIGFAFKDILQNFLAGVLILLQQPFREGDEIQHGDFEGIVERIETRATKLRTFDGRLVVIPNAELYTEPVVVSTAFEKRRSEYDVGVTYDVTSGRAKERLVAAVHDVEGVLEDPPPEALVTELAPSTMNVRIRWWTSSKQTDVVRSRDRVLSAIKDHMAEEGIDLPFPIRTVILEQKKDAERAEDPSTV